MSGRSMKRCKVVAQHPFFSEEDCSKRIRVYGARLQGIFRYGGLYNVLFGDVPSKISQETLGELGETPEERMKSLEAILKKWIDRAAAKDVGKTEDDLKEYTTFVAAENSGVSKEMQALMAVLFFSAEYGNIIGMIEAFQGEDEEEELVDEVIELRDAFSENMDAEEFNKELKSLLAGETREDDSLFEELTDDCICSFSCETFFKE